MTRPIPLLRWSAGRIRNYLVDCVRVDTRSLAVFRIFVGLLVVADVFSRARNFSFYYTDSGIVPQDLARADTHEYAVSVYYFTSDPTLIAALLALQVLIAFALIAGCRSRTATVLTFLLVVSLDHHNPFVLSYADTLFRLLLFWAIFLPLGERWSVDAVHADRPPRSSIASIFTFFALAQLVFMYLLNGVHKTESSLWRSGEATPLIFGIDEMTFLLGEVLGAFPTLLTYGGLLWFYMLLGSWLLFLLQGRLRLLLVGLFVGGHLSFAVTVRIGAFAYVALAGLVLFVQAQFWRDGTRVLRRLGVDPSELLPRQSLRSLADVLPAFRFVPDRYAVLKTGVYHAALGIVLVAVALIGAVFLLNIGVIMDDGYDQHRFNYEVEQTTGGQYVHSVAAGLGIRQPEWSVFAPYPRTTDRYYVFGAITADGDRLDVYNDREFTWDRPDSLEEQHDAYRERFFMNSVRRAGWDGELPRQYGEHICTVYEEERGVELTHISMFEITETITPDTITDPEDRDTERDYFHRHTCGE